MEKESLIKQYGQRILVAKEDIKYCQDRINTLEGFTETCPLCNELGKLEIGHSFRDGTKYMTCYLCNGKGKITKIRLNNYKGIE